MSTAKLVGFLRENSGGTVTVAAHHSGKARCPISIRASMSMRRMDLPFGNSICLRGKSSHCDEQEGRRGPREEFIQMNFT